MKCLSKIATSANKNFFYSFYYKFLLKSDVNVERLEKEMVTWHV